MNACESRGLAYPLAKGYVYIERGVATSKTIYKIYKGVAYHFASSSQHKRQVIELNQLQSEDMNFERAAGVHGGD